MIAVRAAGVLKAFSEAGVLVPADVHVALRLARLGAETSEEVLLAVALAVRGVRTGSVCIDLDTVAATALPEEEGAAEGPLDWPADWSALQASPLVAVGAAAAWRPLRLVQGLLYLDRYWQQEQLVRAALDERAARPAPEVDLRSLPELFPGPAPDRQRLAASVAASRWVSVLTGGPGTGKTHTVARLLKLLLEQPGPPARIALAAPTGKAAARLQEAVQEQAHEIGLPDLQASTLHRLLGWRPDSRSRFRYSAGNHLPYDIVVVDESSMVSLTLMARLLEAVRPSARLVLVGDPDQLTPVQAGAVLSDLVHRPAPAAEVFATPDTAGLHDEERRQLRNGIVRLSVARRYGAEIGALAEAVRTGDADRAVDLLRAGGPLELLDSADALREELVAAAAEVRAAAEAGDARRSLELLGRHRLLCAHRHGPYGVSFWNDQVLAWTGTRPRQAGEPVLVTANDYENRLYNGDTGVVVDTPEGARVAFARSAGPELVSPSRLSAVQTAYALTVHRSQGSQYATVSVVLPPAEAAILTRELLYTAVTRATSRVRIIGTEAAVRAASARQVARASGLRRAVHTVAVS